MLNQSLHPFNIYLKQILCNTIWIHCYVLHCYNIRAISCNTIQFLQYQAIWRSNTFFNFSIFSLHMTSSLSLTYILHFIRHSRRTSLSTSVTEKYVMLFWSHKCFGAWNQDFMNIACLQIKVLNILWVENLSLGRWSLRFFQFIFSDILALVNTVWFFVNCKGGSVNHSERV